MALILLFSFQQSRCGGVAGEAVPIILVHGLIHDSNDMAPLAALIKKEHPNRKVESIEILLGSISTVFDSQDRYLLDAAAAIKKASGDAQCIDLIGHSMGGFVSRAYVQLYSGGFGMPAVRDFYSLAGVLGGYYCSENCGVFSRGFLAPFRSQIASFVSWAAPKLVYSRFAKWHLTMGMQWKDPMGLDMYRRDAGVLARMNGEAEGLEHGEGKEQFLGLRRLVTFYTPVDEVISPRESERFQFHRPGSRTEIQGLEESEIYVRDLFGLRTLREEGRWEEFVVGGYLHRDFVERRVGDFFSRCLSPLLRGEGAPGCV